MVEPVRVFGCGQCSAWGRVLLDDPDDCLERGTGHCFGCSLPSHVMVWVVWRIVGVERGGGWAFKDVMDEGVFLLG